MNIEGITSIILLYKVKNNFEQWNKFSIIENHLKLKFFNVWIQWNKACWNQVHFIGNWRISGPDSEGVVRERAQSGQSKKLEFQTPVDLWGKSAVNWA